MNNVSYEVERKMNELVDEIVPKEFGYYFRDNRVDYLKLITMPEDKAYQIYKRKASKLLFSGARPDQASYLKMWKNGLISDKGFKDEVSSVISSLLYLNTMAKSGMGEFINFPVNRENVTSMLQLIYTIEVYYPALYSRALSELRK